MSLAVRCSQDSQLVVAHRRDEAEVRLNRHQEEVLVGLKDHREVQGDQVALADNSAQCLWTLLNFFS